MCPSSGNGRSSAEGQRRASHSPWDGRDDSIATAVQDQSWCRELLGFGAPRRDVGKVVVDQAAWSLRYRWADDAPQPRPCAGQRRLVSRGELWVVHGAGGFMALLHTTRPAAAARSDSTPDLAMPANQSRPSAPNCARPAMLDHSQDAALQARAARERVGAPTEWPMTAMRSRPRAFARVETSSTHRICVPDLVAAKRYYDDLMAALGLRE